MAATPPIRFTSFASRRQILEALGEAGIFRQLAPFDPHIVGSVPLDVHHAASDIDICCGAPDLTAFASALKALANVELVEVTENVYLGRPSVIGHFIIGGHAADIFAQSCPVSEHQSYRLWKVEARLLAVGGDALRDRVRAHKIAGMKTEAAFAASLRLAGDPVDVLLQLAASPDNRLEAVVAAAGIA
ncbi:DUF4269 domain-containing protein [Hyphobacterium sp.]|uniref:DUF4269 domain-containing protein n=1 Tax=Hyphobacterium sp. TaxID=2004662 RepID=UPI003BA8AD72